MTENAAQQIQWRGLQEAFSTWTSSAILLATTAIESSAVLKPEREASMGLMLRSASYVVLWMMGTSRFPQKCRQLFVGDAFCG